MEIKHITSHSIRRLLTLTEKKDELIKNLEAVENEIASAFKGAVTAVAGVTRAVTPFKPAAKAGAKKAKAGRTGGLKSRILALLEAAGNEGIRVKDIAAKLGSKATNVSVWFSTTGKDITTKLSPGLYAKKGAAKAAKSPKAAKPVKAKRKGGISPEGRAKIAAASKARWAKLRAGKAAPAAAKAAKSPKAAKPVKAKKKSGLTPEGRAKLAANMKARWAARRAAKAAGKGRK